MRIFFDTNVLVSAFIAHGASSEVFKYCLSSHRIFVTRFVMDETRKVLSTKLLLSPRLVEELCGFLSGNLELIEAGAPDEPVCGDPDGDFVLANALTAGADCLITGDEVLFVLEEYRGLRILKPSDFWRFEKTFGSSRR